MTANIKATKVSSVKAGDYRAEAARRGWNDAISGKPFDYDYVDSLPELVAGAYENWRLRALDSMKHFKKLPKWRAGAGLSPRIKELYSEVCCFERNNNNYVAHINKVSLGR